MKAALFQVFVIAIKMLLHSKFKKKTLKIKDERVQPKMEQFSGEDTYWGYIFAFLFPGGKLHLGEWIMFRIMNKYLKKDPKLCSFKMIPPNTTV